MAGRRRVVVTGLGAVTPLGNDVASSWEAMLAGRSGIGPITRFDASGLGCRIAGEVRGFDLAAYMSPKEARRMDTFIHYGIAASVQAIKDSGIEIGDGYSIMMTGTVNKVAEGTMHAELFAVKV